MTLRRQRILATLLALALCLSLLPMSALAAEADSLGETGPEEAVCTCTAPCTEGGMNTACPVCGADGAAPEDCGQSLPQGSGEAKIQPLANDGISLLADTTSAKYLDEKGQEQTCPSATVVTESDTSWGSDDNAEHGYVVNGDVTIGTRVTVTGDVHLILVDGCNLTVSGGIDVSSGNSLNIYAQSTEEGMGKLTANAVWERAAIGSEQSQAAGNITICGGNITAAGGESAAIGNVNGEAGTVTIYGGWVKATGGNGAPWENGGSGISGTVTIHGGQVEATGGNGGGAASGGAGGAGISGTVTIHGGHVEANGGNGASGATGDAGGAGIDGTATIHGGHVETNGGNGASGATGGAGGAGIDGTATIHGGQVEATGGNGASGATGGAGGAGISGTVTIHGGHVEANGGNGASGATGGAGGAGIDGTATIHGGHVETNGGDGVYGASGGAGIGGSFSADSNGSAVIFASSISDHSSQTSWSGVIFEGTTGQVYGTTVTPTEDFTIPQGYTLTIPAGATLDVSSVSAINNGTVICNGSISGTVGGDARYPSGVTVSLTQGEQDVTSASYGSTITITATMQRAQSNGINAIAELGTVDFYLGDTSGTLLGTANVTGSEDTYTATLNVSLNDEQWKPSNSPYTITADFGGVADTSGDGLLPSTGTATLTVTKGNQTAPTAPTMSSRTTNSVTLNAISSAGQGAVQYGYVQGDNGTPNNWQDNTTFNGLSAGTTYTFYARYAGNDYYEPSPVSTGTGIVTLGAEGGDTLADGETITTGDGTTIKNDGEKIIITPGDGGSATVITPDDNVTVNTGDGTVNVPGGSTVTTSDGPSITVGEGGATVGTDGGVTLPENGSATIGNGDDATTITTPGGGTIDPDTGAVTPDEGGSVVIDTGDGTTTITPPSGQPVTPNDDGSVTIPGGSTVTDSDGERVTIPPEGGTLQPGGEVKYTVTVTFDSQGGSQVPSQDITVGEPVSQPDDPTRTGYRFLGWYTAATGGARWDFTQPVTGDQTLYAQWAYLPPANPNYKITIGDTENGTVTVNPTAAKEGTTVTITPVPDAGYQVGTVSVTDRFGQAVAVDQQADGTYTFVMPDGQVTVEVTFLQGEATDLPFSDVTESDWFYDAVTYAYENGLMDGVGTGLFAPNSETTRAQLVTILHRLAGQPAPSGDSGFSDVETGTWYTDAVAWAAQNGIVNGVSDTQFAPGDDITREQLAVILYRYATYQGYDVSQRADLSGFVDAGTISTYAQEALSWASAQGLVLGFEDDSLRPQGNASRAQIAAVLMRFCQTVAE